MPNKRAWCFTLNNPKKHDSSFKVRIQQEDITYLILAREHNKKGKLHYQGYVTFRKPRSLTELRGFSQSTHWEPANGSKRQNDVYCSKEDKHPLIIDNGHQGVSNELLICIQMIKAGCDITDVIDLYPCTWARNHNALDKLQGLQLAHRAPGDKVPRIYWLYGDTGTGKTQYVYNRYDWSEIYMVDNTNDWTGYKQQRVVIIDEFHEAMICHRRLLRLLDTKPVTVNKKFGSVPFNSPLIYITSEFHPDTYYNNEIASKEQLIRRITKIVKFEKNKKPVVEVAPQAPPLEQFSHPDNSDYGLP